MIPGAPIPSPIRTGFSSSAGGNDQLLSGSDIDESKNVFGDFVIGKYESETERVVKYSIAGVALYLGYLWLQKS